MLCPYSCRPRQKHRFGTRSVDRGARNLYGPSTPKVAASAAVRATAVIADRILWVSRNQSIPAIAGRRRWVSTGGRIAPQGAAVRPYGFIE
jgi:hypothetical protein